MCFVDKARAPLNPAEEALDDSVNEDDRMRNAWAFNAVKADILTKSVVFYEEFGEIRGYSKLWIPKKSEEMEKSQKYTNRYFQRCKIQYFLSCFTTKELRLVLS